MQAARFPALEGEALDGTPFSAPRDLAGARTVALFAFALEHRADIESWGPFLDGLVRARPDVRARLFVVLGGGMRMMRGAIVGMMKSAMHAPELRASTIPVFTDVDRLCAALAIGDRSRLALRLVEPDGTVTWSGTGAYAEGTAAELAAALGT